MSIKIWGICEATTIWGIVDGTCVLLLTLAGGRISLNKYPSNDKLDAARTKKRQVNRGSKVGKKGQVPLEKKVFDGENYAGKQE